MNPWNLSASELLIWGIVLHLIADWLLQNDWMATNKAKRAGMPYDVWFIRHPAAYVHAGIHAVCLALVFGWAAIFIAFAHLVIDCRWIVVKWSQLIRQTQPSGQYALAGQDPLRERYDDGDNEVRILVDSVPLYDIGLEVRFWTDQVFHIVCVAVAAVLVA